MPPTFAVNDSMNLALTYPELVTYFTLRHSLGAKIANLLYRLGSYFGVVIRFASLTVGSAFCDFVLHVVNASAKKQVIRITTRRIVAFMKYLQVIGDFAIMQFPRYAVRANGVAGDLQPAITIWHYGALPKPTRVAPAWCDIFPKAFCCWFGGTGVSDARVMPRDKARWLPFDVVSPGIGQLSNRGRQAASTFTEFWGVVRGMIEVHKKSPFLCQAWDVSSVARHFLLVCYQSIIPYFKHFSAGWTRRVADLMKEASL